MDKQFVTKELSFKLREIGFDEVCLGAWFENDSVPSKGYYLDQLMVEAYGGKSLAPLWQQAFDWFREKHGLYIPIQRCVGTMLDGTQQITYTIVGSPWDSTPDYNIARENKLKELIKRV